MPDLLTPAGVRALVAGAIGTPSGVVLYANREPVGPGTVTAGATEVVVPRPAVLVFRDDFPGANWMHPCAYALVEVSTGALLTTVASDRPPAWGFLPASWMVASDPDGRADLVAPASPRIDPIEERP